MARAAGELPIVVVVNAGAGSSDAREARSAMEAGFAAAGRAARFAVARRPDEVERLARAAAQEGPCILAAAGGDGTLNSVASVALDCSLPFGVVPLGTFNYFARELGIPEDPSAAAQVLATGRVRRVAVGRLNGRLFLNNASFGLYRRLIEQREAHKKRFGRSRLVAIVSGLVTLLREHKPYLVGMDIDGQRVGLRTLTVFFGRNALQMQQLGLDEALCVARGELAVLALREVGPWEMLALALRGALARLESAQNLRQHCARRVEVDWMDGRAGRIRVALDGELVDCRLPLLVESVPEALQVVVPQEQGR